MVVGALSDMFIRTLNISNGLVCVGRDEAWALDVVRVEESSSRRAGQRSRSCHQSKRQHLDQRRGLDGILGTRLANGRKHAASYLYALFQSMPSSCSLLATTCSHTRSLLLIHITGSECPMRDPLCLCARQATRHSARSAPLPPARSPLRACTQHADLQPAAAGSLRVPGHAVQCIRQSTRCTRPDCSFVIELDPRQQHSDQCSELSALRSPQAVHIAAARRSRVYSYVLYFLHQAYVARISSARTRSPCAPRDSGTALRYAVYLAPLPSCPRVCCTCFSTRSFSWHFRSIPFIRGGTTSGVQRCLRGASERKNMFVGDWCSRTQTNVCTYPDQESRSMREVRLTTVR